MWSQPRDRFALFDEIRNRLCSEIPKRKHNIAIFLDESTSISRKSCLVIYIRTSWPLITGDCFDFPLALVEMSLLTSEHIFDKVIETLSQHGFSHLYLSENFKVGACSESASTRAGTGSKFTVR